MIAATTTMIQTHHVPLCPPEFEAGSPPTAHSTCASYPVGDADTPAMRKPIRPQSAACERRLCPGSDERPLLGDEAGRHDDQRLVRLKKYQGASVRSHMLRPSRCRFLVRATAATTTTITARPKNAHAATSPPTLQSMPGPIAA